MPSIEDWLNGLGLGKYSKTFAENDVDLRALPHLNSADLQELGVSLGHRKIILAAIAELQRAAAEVGNLEKKQERLSTNVERQGEAEPAGEPGPDLRLLSVLFCDMVDSTGLSVRFKPEEMHDLIGAYQEAVASAVTPFGGYVAKFLGDGVLAYFGWPMAYEDHAERAIRAGLAAIGRVESLRTPTGAPLRSRVGIATGRVVVGDLAGGGALDRGQVAGETPNLAARLQGLAEPGQILIADGARRLASHAFEVEDLGARELKGFEHPVAVFRVVSEREVESRFDARRGEALSQFVGRNSEIGILLDRWELAKGGQGQAVFVSGEAGIGKSRLLEALIERLQDEPHETIRLQCSPYHTTSALYPVIQRRTRVAGLAAGDDEATRVEKLERLLARYGENPADAGPVYAELLSLDLGDRFELADLPAQQRKDLTMRTLANRVFLAAKRLPVLLVVEDAHWIDPSTSELLRDIVLRIHAAPIYVVLTHRPDWSADWAQGHSHVTAVAVGRLTKQQIHLLIQSMLDAVSDRLVDRIADRTDGVPLFAEELARSILDGEVDAQEDIEIPDSLQGSLMARLDRLPAPSKEVAQIAAVIGREFARDLLAEVAALGDTALDRALGQLLAAQLVVMGALSHQSFLFRHALIQDTAYQSLLTRKRRRYHQAIAVAIVKSHPNIVATQPELVARHYTEGQRDELALPYWKKAGERALERFANSEASDHFSNALAIAEKLPDGQQRTLEMLAVRLRLAEAFQAAGRFKAAATQYLVAAEQARQANDADSFVRIALGYDWAQFLLGMPLEHSIALLTEAEAKIAPDDDKQRCQILSQLARGHLLLGDAKRSESFQRQGTELARRLGDRRSLFTLLRNRFLVPRQVTSPIEAQSQLSELNELIEFSEGDIGDQTYALSMDVYVSTELGQRARLDRSLAALSDLGEVRQRLDLQWTSRHGAAMLAILDGDFAAAERFAREGLELGRLTHGDRMEGVYGIQMFSIRREQGRLAEVAPVVKRFIDENPDEKAWLPGFALIAADLGFEEPARRRLRELADTGFEMPFDAKRSASLSYIAEVAVLLGDREAAARLYELLSVYKHMTITAGIATVCYGAASRYLGMLAATLGDFEKAEAHFDHALQMNERMGTRPWLAHTKAEYALLLRRRGGKGASERAEALANEAWETAAELDMMRLKRRLQPKIH